VRILIFNLYFHPEPTGTGLIVGELARDLVRLGHEVTVVTTVPHYGLDEPVHRYRGRLIFEEWWEGVRVLRTRVHVGRRGSVLSRLGNYLSYAVLAIPAGLRGSRPDVVVGVLPPVTTGPVAWLVSRLRRAPLILNVQDVYPDTIFRSSLMARVNQAIERVLLGGAAQLTALSEGQRDALVARGAERARISVVPMWTDFDGVRPGPKHNAFRAAHSPGAKVLALYSGNLGTFGGVGILLEAAQILREDPRIRILIVGRGNAREGLVRRATELGLPNVTFLPTQPRERLAEMLAAADVGLVSLDVRLSVTSVPSKTFTIMAAARPVLAAVDMRNEIARAIREAECGLVVPPDSAPALAAALRAWADDPSSLEAMGSRGRTWVERFHRREPAVRAHEEIFRRTLAGAPGARA
jgi:colanic acid biosynthesis glycosyl transferase WcaI